MPDEELAQRERSHPPRPPPLASALFDADAQGQARAKPQPGCTTKAAICSVSQPRGPVVFSKRNHSNELELPPVAFENPAAVEVLRVWAAPQSPQQLTLRTTWKNPAVWGLVLVDIARHAAQAYRAEGRDPDEVLRQIRELWDSEFDKPTSAATDLTPRG